SLGRNPALKLFRGFIRALRGALVQVDPHKGLQQRSPLLPLTFRRIRHRVNLRGEDDTLRKPAEHSIQCSELLLAVLPGFQSALEVEKHNRTINSNDLLDWIGGNIHITRTAAYTCSSALGHFQWLTEVVSLHFRSFEQCRDGGKGASANNDQVLRKL